MIARMNTTMNTGVMIGIKMRTSVPIALAPDVSEASSSEASMLRKAGVSNMTLTAVVLWPI